MSPMRSALVVSLVLACGCAARAPSKPVAPASRDMLTQEQIQDKGFTTAYDAILALRSNWLETRGTDSFQTPGSIRVYFDGNQLGGIETLSSVMLTGIVYIRHFDGVAATARWGLDHGRGVIYISTHPLAMPI